MQPCHRAEPSPSQPRPNPPGPLGNLNFAPRGKVYYFKKPIIRSLTYMATIILLSYMIWAPIPGILVEPPGPVRSGGTSREEPHRTKLIPDRHCQGDTRHSAKTRVAPKVLQLVRPRTRPQSMEQKVSDFIVFTCICKKYDHFV